MSVNEDLLKKAKLYLSQREILFSDIAIISHLGMNSKKNHVFVISGFNIFILTQKKVSKSIAKKYDKSIFDISLVSLDSLNNIMIQFSKSKNSNEFKLQFQIENPQELIKSILDHINRLLTPYELEKIKLSGLAIDRFEPCTSHSVLDRLTTLLFQNNIEVPPILIKKVAHHLYTHLNSFIFSKFKKMKQFFPIFFPCMSMLRYVNQIDIYAPRRVFPLLYKQMECFDNILHVKIKGPDSEKLKEFVEKSKDINSISFHDRAVQTFEFIASLMENRVNSIGFDSSLDEASFQSFIQLPSFNNLRYFRVSNLNNLDFSSCVANFNRLSVLSLVSCNLEVGDVLEKIISNHITLLKKIDLSGNTGKGFHTCMTRQQRRLQNFSQYPHSRTLHQIDNNQLRLSNYQNSDDTDISITLPVQLEVLFVNDVEWDVNQLIFFMKLCSKSQISNLSINNISFINENKVNPTNMASTTTTTNINDSENKRNRNRHRHSTQININDNANNDEEEDEYSYYDDDDLDESIPDLGPDEDNANYKNLNPIEANTACWEEFFTNIPQQMKSLRLLSWNSNKINNDFLTLLSRSPILTEVSFCGCNCSDIKFVETLLLQNKIQKANLKQIRFNSQFIYFRQFKTFLSHISDMKYLKKLDLSHNNIDDECFDILSESLLRATLDFIALDNSNASSYEVLMKFYQKLEKTKDRQIKISFPILDIQRLEIAQAETNTIIESLHNLSKPLSQRTISEHKYLPEVFYLKIDNNFPQFLSKKEGIQTENVRNRALTQPAIQPASSHANNNNNSNNNNNINLREKVKSGLQNKVIDGSNLVSMKKVGQRNNRDKEYKIGLADLQPKSPPPGPAANDAIYKSFKAKRPNYLAMLEKRKTKFSYLYDQIKTKGSIATINSIATTGDAAWEFVAIIQMRPQTVTFQNAAKCFQVMKFAFEDDPNLTINTIGLVLDIIGPTIMSSSEQKDDDMIEVDEAVKSIAPYIVDAANSNIEEAKAILETWKPILF